MTEPAGNPRERYRAQVRDEVKRHAWDQIATAGVTALSLNAIAKEMGMSGPALYRYFAGRDELITALIRDAYRSLADTVRAAHAAGTTAVALAAVIREWALSDPQRYLLIYGTPVPGYHAPDDITAISDEILTVLLEVCAGEPDEAAEDPVRSRPGHEPRVGGRPARVVADGAPRAGLLDAPAGRALTGARRSPHAARVRSRAAPRGGSGRALIRTARR